MSEFERLVEEFVQTMPDSPVPCHAEFAGVFCFILQGIPHEMHRGWGSPRELAWFNDDYDGECEYPHQHDHSQEEK